MVRKRRRHTAAFKFRVALEALEGSKTISQLSSEHGIHANQIGAWKRQLLEDGPKVFASNAVIDWHSRYVLAWQLSNTLDGIFCLDALRLALNKGRPKIFNTDQGAQFTADAFTACLLAANIQVSMDGRGRALDNVFCERLWRSVKYENIYLNQYDTVRQLHTGLTNYFDFYNHERPHQSLNYRTPAEEHFVL